MIEGKATELEMLALIKARLQHVAWPDRVRVDIKPALVTEPGSAASYEISIAVLRRLGSTPPP